MKIRITKADHLSAWYYDKVGEILKVIDRGKDFILKEESNNYKRHMVVILNV